MSRPKDPTKTNADGVYLSQIESWKNRTKKGNTYYLSNDDHRLAKRVKRKLKVKTVTEAIRHALGVVDGSVN